MLGPPSRRTWPVAGLAMLLAGSACNLLTGADDLDVGVGGSGSDGAGGEGSGAAGQGPGPSGSGAGSTGGASSSAGPEGSGATSVSAGVGGGSSCEPPCGADAYCDASTQSCVCSPGFTMQGGACVPAPSGDPATHTQQQVCDAWTSGHVVTSNDPLSSSGADCDAGTLEQAAILDTLARIDMFRWFTGLGPTTDDAALNASAQKCANLEAWWNFSMSESPHSPPPSSKCYTAEAASAAGQSNIAWGSGNPAQAIDQFMEDGGNETTMGHRRWILNPPLSPVGIGYWEGGGTYGSAECLSVFGSSGNGPNPPWIAMPNQGFVPLTIAQWTWTFHGSLSGIPNAQISMLRVDDNTPLDVQVMPLQQGYGQDCISWKPSGWSPEAGKTYRVTVSGLGGGDVVYDVKPVSCN